MIHQATMRLWHPRALHSAPDPRDPRDTQGCRRVPDREGRASQRAEGSQPARTGRLVQLIDEAVHRTLRMAKRAGKPMPDLVVPSAPRLLTAVLGFMQLDR